MKPALDTVAEMRERPIRVLVWRVPRIIEDILARVLGNEPAFEVIQDRSRVSLSEGIGSNGADVVLTHVDSESDVDFSEPLFAHPYVRILALDTDGRSARLYLLRPECVPLGEVSVEGLTRILHEVVTPGGPSTRPGSIDPQGQEERT